MLDIILLLRKAFPNELIMGFTLRIKYKKPKPKKSPLNPSICFLPQAEMETVSNITLLPPPPYSSGRGVTLKQGSQGFSPGG